MTISKHLFSTNSYFRREALKQLFVLVCLLICSFKSSAQIDTIISPTYVYGCTGDSLIFCLPDSLDDPNNDYLWEKEIGMADTSQISFCYEINNLDASVTGNYFSTITRPSDTIYFGPIVVQELLEETVGGKYFPDQMIVQFFPGTSPADIEALRDTFGATVLEECICDELFLWRLNIPSTLIGGAPLFSIENAVGSAMSRPKTKEVELNYQTVGNGINEKLGSPLDNRMISKNSDYRPPVNTVPIRVAVIDNGINENHPGIMGEFRENQAEFQQTNLEDDDENCVVNDITGYDYVDSDSTGNEAFFTHGTKVALIIDRTFHQYYDGQSSYLQFLNIRSLGSGGDGDLYDLICGTYYAIEEKADIINMSLGYHAQNRSRILESTIKVGIDSCNTIFVASAGNESLNNLSNPHYPSNFNDSTFQIVSVAAVDSTFGDKIEVSDALKYTNYDSSFIDLAARGLWNLADAQGNSELVRGTSMSAAYISGIIAVLKAFNPTLDGRQLKSILLSRASQPANVLAIDTISKNGLVLYQDLLPGAILEAMNMDGRCARDTIVGFASPVIPSDEFKGCYPNPLTFGTTFNFDLVRASTVKIDIFDAIGREYFSYENQFPPGKHNYLWDIQNSDANNQPKGIYFYNILINNRIYSGKLIIN